jgi:AraC-like DNA-binding protein
VNFPADVTEKLTDAFEAAGGRAEALYAAAGVTATAPLGYSELCALYEAAARLTVDPAFGLHVGERTRPGMYGVLGYATAHSNTFGDALERLVTLQRVWSDSFSLELRRERGAASITYRATDPPPPEARRHESEQMMAALATFAQEGAGATPAEVRFEHRAPPDLREHARIFGCPVLFGETTTAIMFRGESLRLLMRGADPKLGALMGAQAEQVLAVKISEASWLERLRAALRAQLAQGHPPSLSETARASAVGARTLQRRLRAEGLSWRDLIDEVRMDRAKDLLADPRLGLAQIAHEAGFSDLTAFHRAFRRIAATTPHRFRLDLMGRGNAAHREPSGARVTT